MAYNRGVVLHLSDYKPADFGVPMVAIDELHLRVWNSTRIDENLLRLNALCFEILDLSLHVAIVASKNTR